MSILSDSDSTHPLPAPVLPPVSAMPLLKGDSALLSRPQSLIAFGGDIMMAILMRWEKEEEENATAAATPLRYFLLLLMFELFLLLFSGQRNRMY